MKSQKDSMIYMYLINFFESHNEPEKVKGERPALIGWDWGEHARYPAHSAVVMGTV